MIFYIAYKEGKLISLNHSKKSLYQNLRPISAVAIKLVPNDMYKDAEFIFSWIGKLVGRSEKIPSAKLTPGEVSTHYMSI